MMIHEITEQVGKHKKRKRVGRGTGSGHGKTCGRGHKGAGSRSGFSGSIRASREGGQIPLFRRLPKRGFSNALFRKHYKIVNLQAIDARFDDGADVTPETLVRVGLIRETRTPVKILGQGQTSKKLIVKVASVSTSARAKIEQAGGSVTVTEEPKPKPKAKAAPAKAAPAKAEAKADKPEKQEKQEKQEKPAKAEKPEAPAQEDKPADTDAGE